jgi:hypothetical protein
MKGERLLLMFKSVSRDGGEAGHALYSLYILEKRRSRNMSCCHKGFWILDFGDVQAVRKRERLFSTWKEYLGA